MPNSGGSAPRREAIDHAVGHWGCCVSRGREDLSQDVSQGSTPNLQHFAQNLHWRAHKGGWFLPSAGEVSATAAERAGTDHCGRRWTMPYGKELAQAYSA